MEIKIVYKKCNEIDIEATTENWKISLEKEINKEKLKNNYIGQYNRNNNYKI